MLSTTVSLVGLISLCSAQSTTTLFLAGWVGDPILASVIGSDATATTYSVACAAGEAQNVCNINSLTLTQGPTMANFVQTGIDYYLSNGCSLNGTIIAACVATSTGPQSKTVLTTALSGAVLASQYHVVTLTDVLPSSTTTTAAPGPSSTTGMTSGIPLTISSSMPSQSITSASPSSSPSGSSTPSATAASKTSSAGLSHATGNCWAVGGMAVALAVIGF